MTCIITSILSSTIGLLWNKVRDSTAEKLQDGDVTDAKIREIVVRDLNDIKTKLDCLSRKDLLSSYRFLKQGVDLLNVSLDQSTQTTQENCGESSTMSSDVASAVLNEVLKLTHAIGNIKIKSCAEYESARKRFKDARRKAMEAFCNEALKVDDRIFAAKLQVVSEILENLESPKAAITSCLSFLRDLHSLPAIRETFSVYLKGGVKSLLGKEERTGNVKSIMMINYVLFQFTIKFGGKLTDRLNWPAGIIELADRSFNPVLEWQKVSSTRPMEGALGEPPNELVFDREIYPPKSAVNSHGQIVVKHCNFLIRIIFRTGKFKVIEFPEPDEVNLLKQRVTALAVDNNDTAYIVSYLKTQTEADVIITYVLHVLNDGYNLKYVGTLDFFENICTFFFVNIAINGNNDIVMIREGNNSVYICDDSGKLKHKFERDTSFLRKLSVSNTNEIIIESRDYKSVNFYTESGKRTSTVKLPEGHRVCGMAFHYVLGKIIMLTYAREENGSYFLLCYSGAGELESSTFFSDVIESWPPFITSHPGGHVAVVRKNSITFV